MGKKRVQMFGHVMMSTYEILCRTTYNLITDLCILMSHSLKRTIPSAHTGTSPETLHYVSLKVC